MSSKRIYGAFPTTTSGSFHYLYRITNLVESKHYYGIRTAKHILPQQDLGVKYFSSSRDKSFIRDQKEHPENYKYKVIIVSDSRKRISELEVKIHQIFDVGNNNTFYNRTIQTSSGFWCNVSGKATMRDSFGNTSQVSLTDLRISSGELVGVAKGTIIMKDGGGNCCRVYNDDPRIASGDLVSVIKGKMTVRDSKGNTSMVSVNDPRIASGELYHATKNKVVARDQNGNTLQVDKSDPRLTTKELVGATKGLFPAKDKNGNTKLISKDSLEWKSGEFVNMQRKFIFITPFGEIINDFTKIPYVKLRKMCILYNNYSITKIIFDRFQPYLEEHFNFNEIEGKTFKDIGFGVKDW